jgi:hypothetical protein
VKVSCDKQLAVIIAKGIDRFPDNTDGMFGFIDIWWIVRILLLSGIADESQKKRGHNTLL